MKKILIFDDAETADIIMGVLAGHCKTVWIDEDKDLISCFETEKPDMVFMNYEVSDCSRFQRLLEQIRSKGPKVPVYLISDDSLLTHYPIGVNGAMFRPIEKWHVEGILQGSKILDSGSGKAA